MDKRKDLGLSSSRYDKADLQEMWSPLDSTDRETIAVSLLQEPEVERKESVTREEQADIAELMRRYVTLIADFAALCSLLQAYEAEGRPPVDWQRELSELQRDPAYQSKLRQFDGLLAAIGHAKSDREVIVILSQVAQVPQTN